MLVIRRKQGEALLIGPDVEIRVVELSANRVVLGIVAPSNVSVLRKEISLAGQQNREAAEGITPLLAARLAAKLRHSHE